MLWTAHATIEGFDTGILLSRPDTPVVGLHNVGEEYLYENYRRLLENETFCKSWNKYLTLATNYHLSEAPHLFTIPTKKDYPERYFIEKHTARFGVNSPIMVDGFRYIRLRVEKFIVEEGKYLLLRGLQDIREEEEFLDI